MLKLLMIGADALCPEYILEHPERYTNIASIIDRGTCASYSAYVQKGYRCSYVSEMNWASMHTGLAPWEHQIEPKGAGGSRPIPSMDRFKNLSPFWEVLNDNGLSVGLWAADCCVNPVEIDGYAISSLYELLEKPTEIRTSPRQLQACEKDRAILEMIQGQVPPRLYPRTLEQQGYDFETLKKNPALAWKAVETYHFQEVLENFEEELDFFYQGMCTVQQKNPVDMLYFYTPTTDLIAHCAMYCEDCDVLVGAYRLLDRYVGKWMETLQPENIILLSDHGSVNFKELVGCADEAVKREAFSAREEVIWLPNGYMAFKARNGALLFTAHALKGLFIASGEQIRHTGMLKEMRTLDIYPTVLELMGVKIPEGKNGYVQDIFNRPAVNRDRLLKKKDVRYRSAAILQCWSPSVTDILLNEIYVRERFTRFTIVGEEKYREIYLHNPRVSGFLPYDDFCPEEFDEVYCGVYNETDGLTRHIKLLGK